ncbi:MAG: glycoside hydrolase family 2 TIM barrel-domain containing protein [Treponemataceae bacterium]
MNRRFYLNNDWQFFETFSEELTKLNCDTSKAVEIRIPHTVKELPFHYFDENLYQMVSCYRKIIKPEDSWKGKKVLITFDAVGHECEVYLNEKKLAVHRCGYTAFTVDLSEELNYEKQNVLAVKVNSMEDVNIPPFGFVVDYMTYGGIYRDVYIDVKNPAYIKDLFLKPEVDLASGKCVLSTEFVLSEDAENNKKYGIRQFISKHKEQNFTELKIKDYETENSAVDKAEIVVECGCLDLWSPEFPCLYDVKTELVEIESGTVIDENTTALGWRKAEFRKNGFFLNGKYYKICGLNRHQSYAYLGYAMPQSMQEFDAKVLKNELGLNAVRTSHYPQSHYFLDACDELGLLVFTEIPGWQHIGDVDWKEQAIENVKEMVVQYRNHTSIVLWGVRINESKDDDDFYKKTNSIAHLLDPTRQTGGVKAHKKASTFEDVYNYNDFSHYGPNDGCEPKSKVVPNSNLPYFISEYNGHMFPTKSFDSEEHRLEHALRHARVLNSVSGYEDICGSFGWCMADYNTHKDFGSGDRICYHGVLDMFRNPKMASYVYSSRQEKLPVLKVSSTMDIGEHPACIRGDTYIFTNADSVKMYKNNSFIKEYFSTDSNFSNLTHGPIAIDDFIGDLIEKNEKLKPEAAKTLKDILNIVARKGFFKISKEIFKNILKLVLVHHIKISEAVEYFTKYIGDWGGKSTVYRFEAFKAGKVVKELTIKPMKSMHLAVDVDHTELIERNSYDVAAVRIRAVDENENTLAFCSEPLMLSCEGPIEIVGPKIIALQGGMFGTYVKTTGKSGEASLCLESATGLFAKAEFNVKIM